MMRIRGLLGLVCTLALGACGQQAADPEPGVQAQPEPPQAAPSSTPEPAQPAALPRQPAPEGATVYLISPNDGDVVTSPVRVVFGLKGIGVAPAGINLPATGHHHLLVDAELASYGVPVPADDNHLHYGLGQTETMVELASGEHNLQLVLGDYLHIPHDPPVMSDVVTIRVQ